MKPLFRFVLYVTGLAAALALLHHAGSALPASPSLADPPLLVVTAVRWAALAAGWYLAAVLVVGAGGRVVRLRPLVRAVDTITLPTLRRLLDASLGLTIVAGAVAAPAAADVPSQSAVTLVRLPDDAPARQPPVTVRPVPPVPVSHTPPPAAEPEQWTVQAGDHFWSIAERVLHRAWARAPGDREVDPYWRRLVAANRARLADPDNPDLLFAGQVLDLPPP